MCNVTERLEISRRHQKTHENLITILVFFERFYVKPHKCKVSWQGPNWFRIYGGRSGALLSLPLPPRPPPQYLRSKKPRLARFKEKIKLHQSNIKQISSIDVIKANERLDNLSSEIVDFGI